MRRYEAIKAILDELDDELIVCNIGHPSQELYDLCDRPQNFYMLGSMGMASSIGLGLAMSQDKTVVVIDGDSAATMNLGSFATMGDVQPRNFIHVIIDNQANGSTGFQRSFTARNLKLNRVVQGAGIENVALVESDEALRPALRKALDDCRNEPVVLVVKTQTGMPDGIKVIPLGPDDIRDRFMGALKK